MGIDISPMPVRHGQTPARRLRLAGKIIHHQGTKQSRKCE
jgi:hypothetical protein